MEPTQNTALFQLNVDANSGYTLKSASSWARILGILGIIFGILFILVGIMWQQAMNRAGATDVYGGYRRSTTMLGNAGMIFYIVCGLLTIIGSVFALNFANKTSIALRTNDPNSLRAGFAGIRNYFAFWTILMIIGLLLGVIAVASGSSVGM